MITDKKPPEGVTREETAAILNRVDECETGGDKIVLLQSELNRVRAEAMMDASWWIWDYVIGTAAHLRIVRKCREAIEEVAQKIHYGAKAYHTEERIARRFR